MQMLNPHAVLPVAEMFYSIQGEGIYTGCPMFFIRLAGCNVGKWVTRHEEGDPLAIISDAATCTSFSGEHFTCDTDYRVKQRLEICEILEAVPEGCTHISITGGEPLIHAGLRDLIELFDKELDVMIHLETSGTLPIDKVIDGHIIDCVCSPKVGFLRENIYEIDQFKFLIRTTDDVVALHKFLLENEIDSTDQRIFLQPIDEMDVSGPSKEAVITCVEAVKANPTWAVSYQLHKVLGVR